MLTVQKLCTPGNVFNPAFPSLPTLFSLTVCPSAASLTRKRLQKQCTAPAKKSWRTKKSAQTIAENEDVQRDNEKLQLIDWKMQWMTFVYFLNMLWKNILWQVYREHLNMNSWEATSGHNKIFDLVKGFKFQVLEVMEVSLCFLCWCCDLLWNTLCWSSWKNHVKTLIQADSMLKQYTMNELLQPFFERTYNATNFIHVWSYMDDYLDVKNSTELGQFFMKSKFFFLYLSGICLIAHITWSLSDNSLTSNLCQSGHWDKALYWCCQIRWVYCWCQKEASQLLQLSPSDWWFQEGW